MKQFLFLSMLVSSSLCVAQIVNIPDANFKNALLFTNCVDLDNDGHGDINADQNVDGEIQLTEAQAIQYLIVDDQNIASLDGIEEFTNLRGILCGNNELTTLDFSDNILLESLSCTNSDIVSINIIENSMLTYLSCGGNQLSELDVSNNILLENLRVSGNPLGTIDLSQNINLDILLITSAMLTELDLSNNTLLTQLFGDNNNLTVLDLTSNLQLLALYIRGNQLSMIDVSSNINLIQTSVNDNPLIGNLDYSQNANLEVLTATNTLLSTINIRNGNNENVYIFDTTNNPNLDCIQVDDEAYAINATMNEPFWEIDPQTSFSEDCLLSVTENELRDLVTVYPNPVEDILTIESSVDIRALQIHSILGELLYETKQRQNSIDISGYPSGMLLLTIQTSESSMTRKILKK